MFLKKRKKTERNIYMAETADNALMILKTRCEIAEQIISFFRNNLVDPRFHVFDSLQSNENIFLSQIGEVVYVEDQDYNQESLYDAKEYELYLVTINRGGLLNRKNFIGFSIKDKKLFISDFWTSPTNAGNGSKMIKCLFEFARLKGVEVIKGTLNIDDINDHRDRLLYFYTKFGFEIKYENDVPYKIVKKL